MIELYNIYHQLLNGSRCLDIRICKYNNEIWCSHVCFLSIKLSIILQQIEKYINKYDTEIIILRIKIEQYWKKKCNINENEIYNLLKKYIKTKLYIPKQDINCNKKPIFNRYIKDIIKNNHNIIAFFDFKMTDKNDKPVQFLRTGWSYSCFSLNF